MTCAWKELLSVLPLWMRKEVDQQGAETLLELRLRINSPPELVFREESRWMDQNITKEDLNYIVNTASRYSPWAAASVAQGYITIAGGHRIGLCGEGIIQNGVVVGMKHVTSLCIRVARDFPGLADCIPLQCGSVLILGPPGWGKTTLLRDLIRRLEMTEKICVVDERNELFPEDFYRGRRIDVLSGCSKEKGIPMLLRAMGPSCIAVDEITDPEDTASLIRASNCGVRLLATAHATSVSDLRSRSVYRPLLENHIFDMVLMLKKDNAFTMERMTEWGTSGLVQY